MAGVLPMPTRLESPQEVFSRVSAREQKLSRLLIFYISGGLLFMLLPGTFLGVWNLISISAQRTAGSVSPAWIQAHMRKSWDGSAASSWASATTQFPNCARVHGRSLYGRPGSLAFFG